MPGTALQSRPVATRVATFFGQRTPADLPRIVVLLPNHLNAWKPSPALAIVCLVNKVRLATRRKGIVDRRPAGPSASVTEPRAGDADEPVNTDTVDPAVKDAADWVLQ